MNGHIVGWALSNEIGSGGDPYGVFTFLADKFQISSANGSESPFIVYTQPTNVGGVLVPAGVYLKEAFIRKGLIGSLIINETLESANYIPGAAGAKLDFENEFYEFNNVVLSRDQEIDAGILNIGNLPGSGGSLQLVSTYFAETNIASSSWTANPSSFYVSVGRRAGSQYGTIFADIGITSTNPAEVQWGWSGEVVPITRWSGAQRLWIKIMFHAKNVQYGRDFQVEWKLKKIT